MPHSTDFLIHSIDFSISVRKAKNHFPHLLMLVLHEFFWICKRFFRFSCIYIQCSHSFALCFSFSLLYWKAGEIFSQTTSGNSLIRWANFALNRLIHQIKNEVNLWHRNKLHYTCVTVKRQVFMTNVPMGNHPIKGQVFHEYLTICWLFLYRFQADLCMHNAMIIRGITFADDVGNVRICVSMEISLLTFDFNFSFGLFGPS